jgi:hypothetical protein
MKNKFWHKKKANFSSIKLKQMKNSKNKILVNMFSPYHFNIM